MSASSFSIEVNPAVLRWAREASGQSAVLVAKRLRVTERAIEQWETGRDTPDWNSLKKLASCYQRPIAALLLPAPPEEAVRPPDFRNLPAGRRELSPATLLAIRTARWLQSRAIEMRREIEPDVSFSVERNEVAGDAESLARAARESLGIELSEQSQWSSEHLAYRRWRESLEQQGILVFQFPFPREESQGFSLFDAVCPVVVVNESDAVQARIFTLFHEYAHLLLNRPGICLPQAIATATGRGIEPFCNRFAASLLIPDSEVHAWRGTNPSDEELRKLARHYRVSKYVVLISLRSRGRLSEDFFAKVYKRWRSQDETRAHRPLKQGASGPSAVKKCARQRGGSFISLVLESARRGLITTHDAITYLGIKLKDLKKLES